MTTLLPIPLLKISGNHFEAGRQLGAATADTLRQPVVPPTGRTWNDMRQLAQPYMQATQVVIPWLHEELQGIAAGSEVDLLDLYARATEEIWEDLTPQPPLRFGEGENLPLKSRGEGSWGDKGGKCSDFAVGPPATADGGIWLAHNNDLSPEAQEKVVAIEWAVADQPRLFTLGVGPFISMGFNAAGLALTGNEVSPNDEKIGVPRLLLVRDILAQPTVAQALAAAARPDRASSYNQLISHADGTIVNFEGSATDYDLIYAQAGWTVHTNHYCSAKMAAYEREPDAVQGSCLRYERARELMVTRPGAVTPAMLKAFLADHANAPYSICAHRSEVQTVFWAVIDLTHGAIEYGRGQPCASTSHYFRFH
jgi:isopenicillin-N N-acyltransferase like protein